MHICIQKYAVNKNSLQSQFSILPLSNRLLLIGYCEVSSLLTVQHSAKYCPVKFTLMQKPQLIDDNYNYLLRNNTKK